MIESDNVLLQSLVRLQDEIIQLAKLIERVSVLLAEHGRRLETIERKLNGEHID